MEIKTTVLQNQGIWSLVKGKTAAGMAATAFAAVATFATSSYAGITEMLASVDISGAETAIETFMGALLLVGLLFLGYKLLKKLGVAVSVFRWRCHRYQNCTFRIRFPRFHIFRFSPSYIFVVCHVVFIC